MAIYSLHHTPVGKSTQAQPYTAAAHVGYITRKRAMRTMAKARLPGDTPREIAGYLRECEVSDRKNARVIDKVMLALPRELNAAQRVELVRDFAEHVTRGRAPWLAAFHDKGKDVQNPHCHLILRDRDYETGKRVIGTSELGSTERLRAQWETFANAALERAGRRERIDRRTLKAQGIEREATVHEGPQSQAMDKRGARPNSRRRRVRNRPGSREQYREVDYRKIDKGQSRPQLNRSRRASSQETERDYWEAIDQDAQRREFQHLASIHNPNSMKAIAGLSTQRTEDKVVHTPGNLTPLRLAGKPPGLAPGGSVSQSALKPSAQRVAGREAEDEGSNALRPRPTAAGSFSKLGRSPAHRQNVNQQGKAGKGISMPDDEDVTNRRRAELANAKASDERARAKYDSLMERSYLDPESAERKMEAYRAKHGDKALLEKLADNARKTAFGRRPGSIASRDGYAPGAGERREGSHIARQYLPEATLEKNRAEERLKYAERAAGAGGKQGQDKTPETVKESQAAKTFKQRLADRQIASPRDQTALDQLREGREKDKGVER